MILYIFIKLTNHTFHSFVIPFHPPTQTLILSFKQGVLLPQPRNFPVEEQEKYNSGYTGANNNCKSSMLSSQLFQYSKYDFTDYGSLKSVMN